MPDRPPLPVPPSAGNQRAPGQGPRLSRDGEALTQFIGVGGFAEQVLVHENTVVSVSKDIPFDRAASWAAVW